MILRRHKVCDERTSEQFLSLSVIGIVIPASFSRAWLFLYRPSLLFRYHRQLIIVRFDVDCLQQKEFRNKKQHFEVARVIYFLPEHLKSFGTRRQAGGLLQFILYPYKKWGKFFLVIKSCWSDKSSAKLASTQYAPWVPSIDNQPDDPIQVQISPTVVLQTRSTCLYSRKNSM